MIELHPEFLEKDSKVEFVVVTIYLFERFSLPSRRDQMFIEPKLANNTGSSEGAEWVGAERTLRSSGA